MNLRPIFRAAIIILSPSRCLSWQISTLFFHGLADDTGNHFRVAFLLAPLLRLELLSDVHKTVSDFEGDVVFYEFLQFIRLRSQHAQSIADRIVDSVRVGDVEVKTAHCWLIVSADTDQFFQAGPNVEGNQYGLYLREGRSDSVDSCELWVDELVVVWDVAQVADKSSFWLHFCVHEEYIIVDSGCS